MVQLEGLKEGASVRGIRSDALVTIIKAKWHGYESATYEFPDHD
jgi:hypothetical protein